MKQNSLTYKVAEYIIKQGKVNLMGISSALKIDPTDVGVSIEKLKKVGVISRIQQMQSKLIATGPSLILITDIEKVKELLIEVKDSEEVIPSGLLKVIRRLDDGQEVEWQCFWDNGWFDKSGIEIPNVIKWFKNTNN